MLHQVPMNIEPNGAVALAEAVGATREEPAFALTAPGTCCAGVMEDVGCAWSVFRVPVWRTCSAP